GSCDRDRDLAAATGVPDQPPGRDRDHGRDEHRDHRVAHVLREQRGQRVAALEPGGVGEPRDRLTEEVHAAVLTGSAARARVRPVPRPARVHGMRTRPASTSRRSTTRAMTTTAVTPASTSATIRRCRPFSNRYPRLVTPMRMPTVASEIVLTAATRSPASRTGPDSGSSTVQKRRAAP